MAFEITVHDVGHGQAIHIRTEMGTVIAIDLGCTPTFSPLKWLKDTYGGLNRLLITHPHGDHIDEVEQVTKRGLEPNVLIRPRHLSETTIRSKNRTTDKPKIDAYLALSARYTETLSPLSPWGRGPVDPIQFEFFSPTGCGESNLNDHSIVAYIHYNDWGFMFPGDNEPASWRELLKNETFRQRLATTQVFMPSHHARQSGYCDEIFEFLKPRVCVISDKECQDTDYSSEYAYRVSGEGLLVKHASGQVERRKTLTTRTDGTIFFTIQSGSTDLGIGAKK